MEEQLLEQQNEAVQEHSPEVEVQQEPRASVPAPSDSPGFRNLRKQKEQLEAENRAMADRLRKLEEAQHGSSAPDDLVERRYVDDRVSKVEQRIQAATAELQLRAKYPDLDKVVNEDTIALLREKNPSLAAAIGSCPDMYNQASAAYEAIRNLGLYSEDNYSGDRERAQYNAAKPKPTQSIAPQSGEHPLHQANAFAQGLTDDAKKRYWQEMRDAMKLR